MPKYVLTYFNVRARGELSRLALVYAGADWEDKRITRDEWGPLKPLTSLNFLPLLDVEGGLQLQESLVIPQYIAEEHGFGGGDAVERARVRMAVQYGEGLFTKLVGAFFENDEAKKESLTKDLAEKHVPSTLANWEKLVQDNGNGVFVGKNLTTADLQLYHITFILRQQHPNILDKYPGLKGVYEKVTSEPKIAAYLETRPETKF